MIEVDREGNNTLSLEDDDLSDANVTNRKISRSRSRSCSRRGYDQSDSSLALSSSADETEMVVFGNTEIYLFRETQMYRLNLARKESLNMTLKW